MMRGKIAGIALCLLVSLVWTGCSKSGGPPVPIKYVQVQATYLSEGYDIYQYVAVKRPVDRTQDKMNILLDYFEGLYRSDGKVKVMVFPDSASAIAAVSDRVLATLEMENGEVIMRTINVN